MATIPEPLFYRNSGDLQIMTSTDIAEVIDQAITAFADNPAPRLTPTTSVSTLGPISDTRLRSGASLSNSVTFEPETNTEEPTTVTTDYYITSTLADSDQPTNPLPLYRRPDGSIRSMNVTDFLDTFIHPAIDIIMDSASLGTTNGGGLYRINSSDTLADHTLESVTPVFNDTRANTAAYSATAIPSAGNYLDYPTTINSYYLMRANGPNHPSGSSSVKCGAFRRSDGNIQAYSLTGWNELLQKWMRYETSNTPGYKIRYSLSTGTISGTGITDTKLTGGSGVYATNLVNSDDYRSQEFPDGTASDISTTYLRVYRD
jgi:hypothetical protein